MKNLATQNTHVSPLIVDEDFQTKQLKAVSNIVSEEEKISMRTYMIALEIKSHALLS